MVKVKEKIADKPAHESDNNDEKIYFMALGGLAHVGQNMYVYKYKGKYLIVDCGMGFLEEEQKRCCCFCYDTRTRRSYWRFEIHLAKV